MAKRLFVVDDERCIANASSSWRIEALLKANG